PVFQGQQLHGGVVLIRRFCEPPLNGFRGSWVQRTPATSRAAPWLCGSLLVPGPGALRAWATLQLEAPIVLPTLVNVVLALLPSVVIAAMQTTMIRASITAYSTAVGPSSFTRKLTALS